MSAGVLAHTSAPSLAPRLTAWVSRGGYSSEPAPDTAATPKVPQVGCTRYTLRVSKRGEWTAGRVVSFVDARSRSLSPGLSQARVTSAAGAV